MRSSLSLCAKRSGLSSHTDAPAVDELQASIGDARLLRRPRSCGEAVPDAARAKAFFAELLGWSFTPTVGENAWLETPGVRGGLHDGDDASNIVLYFSVPEDRKSVV